MISVEAAVEAAEARKAAAMGEVDEPTISVPNLFQRRAVFGGFDIDESEVAEISKRAGQCMAHLLANSDMSLQNTFTACWVDAFLTGLMVGKLSKLPDDG